MRVRIMKGSNLLLVLTAFFLGCREPKLANCEKLTIGDPKISEFANSHAAKFHDLSLFDLPKVRLYEKTEYKARWDIFYKGKSGNIHDWFAISIDLDTCQPRFVLPK